MRIVAALCLLFGLFIAFAMSGLGAQQKENQEFMRAKLKHSQEIVEGLALENFDQIAKNAQRLTLLSHASSWQVFQTEEYQLQSREFQRATAALREQAKQKKLEGAVLAYLDVTMKCVNCHKYIRSVRMASLESPLRELVIASAGRTP